MLKFLSIHFFFLYLYQIKVKVMNIHYTASQVYNILKSVKESPEQIERLTNHALMLLEDMMETTEQSTHQTKDGLLEDAINSGGSKFKLIGRVNQDGLELMEWCEDANNFNFMCPNQEELKVIKGGDYLRSTYTLEELPEVIDNALNWHNTFRRECHKFNTTQLHILVIE